MSALISLIIALLDIYGIPHTKSILVALLGLLASLVFLALATAVHNGLHLKRVSELGIEVQKLVVTRLGSINY